MSAQVALAIAASLLGAAVGAGADEPEVDAPRPPPDARPAPAPVPTAPVVAPAPPSDARAAPAPRPAAPAPAAPAADAPSPGPTITGGSISGGTLRGADISGATITGGTISGGTISGGAIAGGSITGAKISGSTITGGHISDSAISGPAASGPSASGPAASGPSASGPPASRPAADEQRPRAPSQAERTPPRQGRVPRAPQTDARAPDAERRGSGGGDDDDEVAARALQRSLVQRGALLLPLWSVEFVPGITYGHGSEDTVVTVPGPSPTATPTALSVRRRSHQLTGALTARVGLPWDLQAEASVPVARAWSSAAVGGSVRDDAFGSGLGDPRFTLTRQLVYARNALPDVLLSGTFKPRIGTSPFDAGANRVGLGSGFPALGATLTATKTADPLVFLASASYTANLPTHTGLGRRDPGDTWGLGGGVVLAVSPETSMSFLLDSHFKSRDRLGGSAVLGSDVTDAVLQLGLATVLSRRTLLNFVVGIGLTPDSPDFQLGVTVPVRF